MLFSFGNVFVLWWWAHVAIMPRKSWFIPSCSYIFSVWQLGGQTAHYLYYLIRYICKLERGNITQLPTSANITTHTYQVYLSGFFPFKESLYFTVAMVILGIYFIVLNVFTETFFWFHNIEFLIHSHITR